MILTDTNDNRIYYNTTWVFAKEVRTVYRDEYNDTTVISYLTGETQKLLINMDSHEEVVDKAEEIEKTWKENLPQSKE